VPESNPTLTVNLAILIGIALGLLFWLLFFLYLGIEYLVKLWISERKYRKEEREYMEKYWAWEPDFDINKHHEDVFKDEGVEDGK